MVFSRCECSGQRWFCCLSHLRNVQQEPEDQGSPSPLLHCHPAHKDLRRSLSIPPPLYPLIRHPSIHPPVRPWRDPAQPTDVSRRQVESSLTRAPPKAANGPCRGLECRANSILVVDKVKRAGAVPSVSIMGQRCCTTVMFLWYSKGDAVSYIIREQRDWLGVGGERRWVLPAPESHIHTLTLTYTSTPSSSSTIISPPLGKSPAQLERSFQDYFPKWDLCDNNKIVSHIICKINDRYVICYTQRTLEECMENIR